MNDTSSNAMTEVALGLSMAFFSILILALMSMGVRESGALESEGAETFAHISMQAKIDASNEGTEISVESQTNEDSRQTLYFYVEGRFFNNQGRKVSNNLVTQAEDLVIAVAEDLPIQEALALQEKLSGTSMKMTTMSNDWLNYLVTQR